ncbi:MAG: hypothetical protein ABIF11_05340 [Nitrospirota bacterium]
MSNVGIETVYKEISRLPNNEKMILFSMLRGEFYVYIERDRMVNPCFGIKNEPSLIEESFKKTIPEDIIEFNSVVRIPPVKEWTARVRVKSVEKAIPHIVEPEGILQ